MSKFEEFWESYWQENPTHSRIAKDGGIISVGLPHPCGCAYCRGKHDTKVGVALTQQIVEAGGKIDNVPSCATKKC